MRKIKNMETQLNEQVINQTLINQAYTYDAYMNLLNTLFEQGKTTGEEQSEDLLNYAKLNLQRMNRLNKTLQLSDNLIDTIHQFDHSKKMTWLLITEGWCGDAAQNIPLIAKIAEESNQVDLKLVLRDENLNLIDAYLTNGGRAIPKMIVLDSENLEVIGTWGPRPKEIQDMVPEFKKLANGDHDEFSKHIQLWYAKDKTQAQQKEFVDLLKEWNSI